MVTKVIELLKIENFLPKYDPMAFWFPSTFQLLLWKSDLVRYFWQSWYNHRHHGKWHAFLIFLKKTSNFYVEGCPWLQVCLSKVALNLLIASLLSRPSRDGLPDRRFQWFIFWRSIGNFHKIFTYNHRKPYDPQNLNWSNRLLDNKTCKNDGSLTVNSS